MKRGLALVASSPLGGGYRRLIADEAIAQSSAAVRDVAVVRRSVAVTAAAEVMLAHEA